MTEKERFQRAFAPLHASQDTMTEVMKMTERKTKRPALRRAATIGLAAALVLALGSVAYASDLGGIQRTVQLWLNGEMTDATLTVKNGHYTVNYTVRGFNLEETKEIIKTRPQLLSLQEIYRIAESCQPGSEEFNRSFQVAAAMFPDDPIANLNAGAMEIQKGGDLTTAKKHLAKADQKAPETLNNLGVIALLEGDYDAAEKYFNAAKAGGLTTQADTNMKQLKSIRNYPKE